MIGGIKDFDNTSQVLNYTSIEYLAIATPLISELNLVNHWASGDTSKARCIGCMSPGQWGRCCT
ncbi:hypothetical protein [Clostridium sp. DL-VIII]|uniref:hypothetical protein n=1 Tax=Clostridium sp. DL-VIII TaxID=641107 RepID=UPI00163E8CDE|nr:hypothetical protein [Clostridium sp. DL-VIII]